MAKRNLVIGDGQVTTTAAQVTAGPSNEGGRINVSFLNTNARTQTLTLTYTRDGGTARNLVRLALKQYWRLEISGLPMNFTDSLLAVVDLDTLSIDYIVSVAAEGAPFYIRVYDATGAALIGSASLDTIATAQQDAVTDLGNLGDIADMASLAALNQNEKLDLLLACFDN